ncbi:MAG TPA: hypothetical protein VEG24_09745 [Gaiellaceae bacterium]|nr:hypothetical protein [Gaiellaceae bacterium]
MRALALLVLAGLALVATGCGARSSAPYTATGTAKCLTSKGFTDVTTNPVKVGFIAGFADNGGLLATAPGGNVLTIAFAGDTAGAAQTETAFRAHATPFYKRHMADIMESKRNAVLVWTTAPTQQQINDAMGCLGS